MACATRGLRLPTQLQSVTAPPLVPNYTVWLQAQVCLSGLLHLALHWVRLKPATCWSQFYPRPVDHNFDAVPLGCRVTHYLACCAMPGLLEFSLCLKWWKKIAAKWSLRVDGVFVKISSAVVRCDIFPWEVAWMKMWLNLCLRLPLFHIRTLSKVSSHLGPASKCVCACVLVQSKCGWGVLCCHRSCTIIWIGSGAKANRSRLTR